MSTFIPSDVQAGLDAARKRSLARNSRLRVETGDRSFRILRFSETGFSLDADTAPNLRGLVDLYDGGRHIGQCLIVASDEENGELRFEYKRNTCAHDRAPLDFAREENAPIALLGHKSEN